VSIRGSFINAAPQLGDSHRHSRKRRTRTRRSKQFSRQRLFSSQNPDRLKIFRVMKIFALFALAIVIVLFRGKSPVCGFFPHQNCPRAAVLSLSTTKLTENFRKQPLNLLTVPKAIPISCGQGSGHPHPVVVDNVLGSFGNLVSPDAFYRL